MTRKSLAITYGYEPTLNRVVFRHNFETIVAIPTRENQNRDEFEPICKTLFNVLFAAPHNSLQNTIELINRILEKSYLTEIEKMHAFKNIVHFLIRNNDVDEKLVILKRMYNESQGNVKL
jgi:hypothetical protein